MFSFTRTSTSTLLVIFTTLLVLLTAPAPSNAQVSSAFAGTSFPLSSYQVSNTFTPVTTFAQATGGNPTVIGGPGPSPATASYQYSYTVPTATVPAIYPSQVYQSLASKGLLNTASDARELNPSPENLQFANTAADALNFAGVQVVLATVAAAVIAVVAL